MQNHEILNNEPKQKKYVFNKLHSLLKNPDLAEVRLMVAFISMDGIYLILNELRYLLAQNTRIVIITGAMNNFNSPKVFELLLQIYGLEIRIANVQNYHPKLYIFKFKNGHSAYIIGSSNLTNSALRRNVEANLYLEEGSDSTLSGQLESLYQQLYAESGPLSRQWLDKYRLAFIEKAGEQPLLPLKIEPNKLQIKALAALARLRQENQSQALIISATGTGKTFLSAFDVKAFKTKRLLFIAHRENILNLAMGSYAQVIKEFKPLMLSGKTKNFTGNAIFATIQTLYKDEYLHQFAPNSFDYIVIDEVHRAGAASYQKIMNYFKPKFLLGMSATPERNDDFDIYHLFGHNIAYEIRLNEALEEELLCPFHYFGISELKINNTYLADYSNFNKINFAERVEHILKNIKLYGYAGNKVKGLVFTSRIEEAEQLAQLFKQHGYQCICLSGKNSAAEREAAIELLANNFSDAKGQPQSYLDYIFSVDIFNEGIDIPSVNQIVLLRPTLSAIIFTQQLGRGLRKNPAKEYCVVLDFIGNYASNFLIAVALSGNNTYDKESLRRFIYEANSMISTNATVTFEPIIREQIFASINKIQISKKFIDQNYLALRSKLNRIPRLLDFREHDTIDPKIIFKYTLKTAKTVYNNYYELLKKHQDISIELSAEQFRYLNYISQELLFAARPDEIYVLNQLISGINTEEMIFANLAEKYNTFVSRGKIAAIKKNLTLATSAALTKKYAIRLLEEHKFSLAADFSLNLNQQSFKHLVQDTLELGLSYFTEYKSALKYHDFIIYNKYSRKETVRLLNVNLSLETSIYGYRIINNAVPIFVTYSKTASSVGSARYQNTFLNQQDFIWYSRPATKITTPEINRIIRHQEHNLTILLFLKKSAHEGNEYYYLGNANVHQFSEEKLPDGCIVKFILRLNTPLNDVYYDYITN